MPKTKVNYKNAKNSNALHQVPQDTVYACNAINLYLSILPCDSSIILKNIHYSCLLCFENAIIQNLNVFECHHSKKYIHALVPWDITDRLDLCLLSFFNRKTYQLIYLVSGCLLKKNMNGLTICFIQGYPDLEYYHELKKTEYKIVLTQPDIYDILKNDLDVVYYNKYLTVSLYGFAVYSWITDNCGDSQCIKLCFPDWVQSLFINHSFVIDDYWYSIQKKALDCFADSFKKTYNYVNEIFFLVIPYVGAYAFFNINELKYQNASVASLCSSNKESLVQYWSAVSSHLLESIWKRSWILAIQKTSLEKFKPCFAITHGLDIYYTLWQVSGEEKSKFVNYISDYLHSDLYKLEWLDLDKRRELSMNRILTLNDTLFSIKTSIKTKKVRFLYGSSNQEKRSKVVVFKKTYVSSFRKDRFTNNLLFLQHEEQYRKKVIYDFNKSNKWFVKKRITKRILKLTER